MPETTMTPSTAAESRSRHAVASGTTAVEHTALVAAPSRLRRVLGRARHAVERTAHSAAVNSGRAEPPVTAAADTGFRSRRRLLVFSHALVDPGLAYVFDQEGAADD
ncbi:hypothetical protein [Nocardia sp. NPDC127526]|uniref:hypothetical protein n=1 Tax=Nocardia sp. NPDC127526 TaxID=3345393 RepID=UPI0036297256